MDRKLIEEYEAGGEKLSLAIRGLKREDLVCVPAPDRGAGKWSIQQVVIHVQDAESAMADRMRRIIAQDEPVLLAWDENKFIERMLYDEQSAEDAAKLVELTRAQLGRVLRKLPDSAFARAGNHDERGRQTLADVLGSAVSHMEHHLKFIKQKRELMGKEVW